MFVLLQGFVSRVGYCQLIQPLESSSLTFHPEVLRTVSFSVWIHFFSVGVAKYGFLTYSFCICYLGFCHKELFLINYLVTRKYSPYSRINAWFFPLKYFQIMIWYPAAAAAAAKSLQSFPTLYDPIDGLLPGSSVPGILQGRTLEWVAISFPNAWKWKVKVKSLSRVRLLATSWTAAYQAPPSLGFSRQEYWIGVPLPSMDLVP